MAYGQGNNSNRNFGNNSNGFQGKAAAGAVEKKTFEKDPSEVGIAYLKSSEKVGEYFSVSISQDIPAGAKLVIFQNNTKNRTEKTPTHVIKLSTAKGK